MQNSKLLNYINSFLVISFLFIISCESTNNNENDEQTNIVSVKICNQVWTAKNLDVDRYQNGDIIPQVTDLKQWLEMKTGAWCYAYNDSSIGKIYGKLYNWYAVNDPRGLAPKGWHIPSDDEWTELITCLGGESRAGEKLKIVGTTYWWSPNNATNESGFSALGGGGNTGSFNLGEHGIFWSSTSMGNEVARSFLLEYKDFNIRYFTHNKKFGFSVRCVKN